MSDRKWIVMGFCGLIVAAVVMPDPEAGRQPRSKSSGLFSRDTPVRNPLDSAETYRLNQQATRY